MITVLDGIGETRRPMRRSVVRAAVGTAVAILVAAGCARSKPAAAMQPAVPLSDSRPALSETAEPVGESVKGRPIELVTFGAGPRPVLVLGAIHGDEPTSADLTRGLLAELRSDPMFAGGVPVAVIAVMNPDGLAAGMRFNARRVDLNRNFAADNYRAGARRGGEPLSEPESRGLAGVIERLRPRLIVSVHSMERPCNNYDGPARDVAEEMSRHNGYPATPTIGYPTPGSLGSWAGNDLRIPIVTLELPRRLPADRVWPDNREAVRAALRWAAVLAEPIED